MPTPTSAQDNRGATPPLASGGATLLEIIIAMLVIAMVAAGIMSAFVFSRRVTWRSGTELSAAGLTKQTVDDLRMAIGGPAPNGLSLAAGIYVDQNMQNAPVVGVNNPTPLAVLNFPGTPADPNSFARFQTDAGTAPTIAGHGDGRLIVVENADENGNGPADEDLDGDGLIGLDFDGDGQTDLRRVRVRVRWTTPST